MQIKVEESGIAQSAIAAEAAASAAATIQLHGFATAVALAMPGSHTAAEATRAATALADTGHALAVGLAEHAETLRAAVGCYADAEDHIIVEARYAAGVA